MESTGGQLECQTWERGVEAVKQRLGAGFGGAEIRGKYDMNTDSTVLLFEWQNSTYVCGCRGNSMMTMHLEPLRDPAISSSSSERHLNNRQRENDGNIARVEPVGWSD